MHLFQKSTPITDKAKLNPFFYISEKLDGMRCTWIPQTAGLPAKLCPLYNYLKEDNPDTVIASGLWSNGGIPIYPPAWFVNSLPPYNLDGELWAGRGKFQLVVSVVRGLREKTENDERWKKLRFVIYDVPPMHSLMEPRSVKVRNETVTVPERFKTDLVADWVASYRNPAPGSFENVINFLRDTLGSYESNSGPICMVDQHKFVSNEWLDEKLTTVLSLGAEGLIARPSTGIWLPERVKNMYKIKPALEAEATIIGATPGKDRLDGMIGALVLRMDNGKEFKLSGMTDAERTLTPGTGDSIDLNMQSWVFSVGQRITFKFREYTADGVPKEARFFRKRTDSDYSE